MQYIICYDIADDHRRNHLAQALLDFGLRIQESVFAANLDDELKETMLARIRKLVEPSEDRVHVFALCAACSNRTVTLGQAEIQPDREFYVL